MTWREAKTTIRTALGEMTNDQLASFADDLREGKAPFHDRKKCLAGRFAKNQYSEDDEPFCIYMRAYLHIAGYNVKDHPDRDGRDKRRQRIVYRMVLAEIGCRLKANQNILDQNCLEAAESVSKPSETPKQAKVLG